jgi:hypothetical protein
MKLEIEHIIIMEKSYNQHTCCNIHTNINVAIAKDLQIWAPKFWLYECMTKKLTLLEAYNQSETTNNMPNNTIEFNNSNGVGFKHLICTKTRNLEQGLHTIRFVDVITKFTLEIPTHDIQHRRWIWGSKLTSFTITLQSLQPSTKFGLIMDAVVWMSWPICEAYRDGGGLGIQCGIGIWCKLGRPQTM